MSVPEHEIGWRLSTPTGVRIFYVPSYAYPEIVAAVPTVVRLGT